MAQKKMPFDLVLTKTASAGSNDLSAERVKMGRLSCIQRVGVENETTACTDVRIMKVGGWGEFLIAEQDTVVAATLYWYDKPFYLIEGEYLTVRFTGCTADDTLMVYVAGWDEIRREKE